jgi:Arc/MetJ-type ribon-helix-helix transcriptional regulator
MKERKTKQIRIRLTESQLKKMVSYIIDHPNEFKNQSQLIRESISDRISRKKRGVEKTSDKNKKTTQR